jgi:hypothetical protein
MSETGNTDSEEGVLVEIKFRRSSDGLIKKIQEYKVNEENVAILDFDKYLDRVISGDLKKHIDAHSKQPKCSSILDIKRIVGNINCSANTECYIDSNGSICISVMERAKKENNKLYGLYLRKKNKEDKQDGDAKSNVSIKNTNTVQMNYYLGLMYLDFAANVIFMSKKELMKLGEADEFTPIKKYIARAVSQPKQDIKIPKETPSKLEGQEAGEAGEAETAETAKTSHQAVKDLLNNMNTIFENGGADTSDPSVKRFISEMSKIYNKLKKYVPDQDEFKTDGISSELTTLVQNIKQEHFNKTLRDRDAAKKIQGTFRNKQLREESFIGEIGKLKNDADKKKLRKLIVEHTMAKQEGNDTEIDRKEKEIAEFLEAIKSSQGGGGKTRRRCVRINLKKSRKPKVAKKINHSKKVKLNLRQTYKNKKR